MSRKNRNARHQALRPMNTKAVQLSFAAPEGNKITMLDEHTGFEFTTLYSTMLESDVTYQRDIEEDRVEKIVNNFDSRVVNPLKVSFRDGHYWVFDGAHTLAALKKIHKFENFPVSCMVFHGLTYADEAYLFALQRGESKDVARRERLNALILSGDIKAVDFNRRITDAGFRIAIKGSSAPCALGCLDKLWRRYEEDPEVFSETLSLLMSCWRGEHWSLSANIIGGLYTFLQVYGDEYSRERFLKNLKNADLSALNRNKSETGTLDYRYAYAMLKLYNKGGGKTALKPYGLYDLNT